MNNIFYKDVKCVITEEGKTLFTKQTNGIKFATVRAALFSNDSNNLNNMNLEKLTFNTLKKYNTIILQNVSYTFTNKSYKPTDETEYELALSKPNNYIPLNIAYNKTEPYMSFNLNLLPSYFTNIKREEDLNFDGFAIIGLPFKQTYEDNHVDFLLRPDYAILALVYFPNQNEKLQILYNQDNEIAMNYEIKMYLNDFIKIKQLSYNTTNTNRFLYGLHLTNKGI